MTCEAKRYSDQPCDSGRYEVVYISRRTKVESDRHPTCFVHGLAEVDRHYRSAGMVDAELREVPAR